ncbi:hypothetical protein D9757_004792 [Collybiopsis confluens]|uniref:HMG box domain-containing protein n=1 Tax=Collybiopsis confluens TaxID=2823264 RepID=A0A8H5HSW8_9AGAR|nr:hypothetical protein D9757_004792 [Collybiopsis confluens]
MPVTRARTKNQDPQRNSSDCSPQFFRRSEEKTPEFSFAPNITPQTYTCNSESTLEEDVELDEQDLSTMRFPPSSATPISARRRRRVDDGKIPRPPNAFMLFRSEFIKQQHIPGSIETDRTSLSKIIGSCWRLLAEEEKAVWYRRAKAADVEHKRMYPDYRFCPVHGKKKGRSKKEKKTSGVPSDGSSKMAPNEEDIISLRKLREEFIARCLTRDGKEGDELKQAVAEWESEHGWEEEFFKNSKSAPAAPTLSSRSSPGQIAIPTLLPIFSQSPSLPSSRTRSVAPSRYPSPFLNVPYSRQSSRADVRIGREFQNYDLSSPLPQHSLHPLTLPLSRYDDSSIITSQLVVDTEPSLNSFLLDPNAMDLEANDHLCRAPDNDPYHEESGFLHYSEHPYSYHVDAPSHHQLANKMSLDFLDSCAVVPDFDALHPAPLSDIVSETSSRPSTTYTGSPAPILDEEDDQIDSLQALQPISSGVDPRAVDPLSGTVMEREVDEDVCGRGL